MFRFFVEEKIDNHFILSKEVLNHIKVARIEKENFICTYNEVFYITKLNGNKAEIIIELNENHEFDGEVILACGVIDFKRMEWLIQKAAELGATKFIPMISKNISQRFHGDKEKKIERWKAISRSACEQSFRNKIMMIENVMDFDKVISLSVENKFIAHEKSNDEPLISMPQNSLILIGPEGGFDEMEVQKAQNKGFEIISFGKRILRAETAALHALSKII